MRVSIEGLDKAKVLMALFNHSRQQGMGILGFSGARDITEEEARDYIDEIAERRNDRMYFDYLRGRVLKVDIAGHSFDASMYDRDNGHGAARRAINSIGGA